LAPLMASAGSVNVTLQTGFFLLNSFVTAMEDVV
jgi:hypothetical protein